MTVRNKMRKLLVPRRVRRFRVDEKNYVFVGFTMVSFIIYIVKILNSRSDIIIYHSGLTFWMKKKLNKLCDSLFLTILIM